MGLARRVIVLYSKDQQERARRDVERLLEAGIIVEVEAVFDNVQGLFLIHEIDSGDDYGDAEIYLETIE